jgi:hypothetical protein
VSSRLRLTAACLAVCAAACSDAPTAPDRDLIVTTAGPVRFRAGEVTSVEVTATNNSKSRTYQIAVSGCEDPFTVTTAAGVTLPAAARVCTLAAYPPRPLPPGQSLTLSRDWVGDVGVAGSNGVAALLPPGTYVVRGFVRVVNGSSGTTVASNGPLTTEVLAR